MVIILMEPHGGKLREVLVKSPQLTLMDVFKNLLQIYFRKPFTFVEGFLFLYIKYIIYENIRSNSILQRPTTGSNN